MKCEYWVVILIIQFKAVYDIVDVVMLLFAIDVPAVTFVIILYSTII